MRSCAYNGRLHLPPLLPAGGTLGIVSPAGPSTPESLDRGIQALRANGYRVVSGRHVMDRRGHLAGRDQDRAADLMEMFLREDVDAILCARGGSGSIRLLPYLDWEQITAHPKPFFGYSDITTLQLALLKRCGLPSFFAPMVASDFARGVSPECVALLARLSGRAEPAGELMDARTEQAVTMVGGAAEGPLVGGTLALVAATLGTPYEIETGGAVLFLEDVHESPARVERMLMQLLLAGKLESAAGFLLGKFPYDATEEERQRCLPLEEVLSDLLCPLGKPLVYGWPHGHLPSPVPLPMGVRVRLDADRKSVTVLEPAVRVGSREGKGWPG